MSIKTILYKKVESDYTMYVAGFKDTKTLTKAELQKWITVSSGDNDLKITEYNNTKNPYTCILNNWRYTVSIFDGSEFHDN